MKKIIITTAALGMLMSLPSYGKTRVAVSTFDDKSGSERCSVRKWFGSNRLGTGFQEQLISQLSQSGKFSIQERTNLKKMYSEEHNLINSDKSAAPRANKFKAAHYSITGAVTSFEMCQSGMGGKVDVGGLLGFKNSGLKVGGKRSNAKVKMDIRIVDVETGEVVKSFTTEGSASATNVDVEGDIKGADFESDVFKNTPIGEATRDAIARAAEKIVALLPGDKKDPELAESEQRSSKSSRRTTASKTTGSSGQKAATRSSSRATAMETATSLKQFCPTRHDYHVQMCKTIKKSNSGTRIQVLNLLKTEKKIYKPDQVLTIGNIKKAPSVGDTVYVPCSVANVYCSGKSEQKYIYNVCSVVDGFDSESVVSCNGKEFQVGNGDIYSKVNTQTRSVARK